MLRSLLLPLLLLAAGPAVAATAYKCEVDGRVVFSDRPCGDNQQEVEVQTQEPAESTWDYKAARQEQQQYLRREELEREIRQAEARIRNLQRERDAEIAALRRSQRYSANNLAGATRNQSIAQEMQAVSNNYQTQIETERNRLQDLRSQLRDH